ncbi:MAG: hypothetical protein JW892_03130 [Anaerolineae bacterium]|nr:hypothetical protein [Anaerolineae bacterium]
MIMRFRDASIRWWGQYRLTVFLLILLATIAYGSNVLTPSLLGDEWGVFNEYRNHNVQCPTWGTARPLACLWRWGIYKTVYLNVYAFHAMGVVISVLSAVLLMILLDQVLPDQQLFNSAVATLFLVYPADLTRTWLAGSIVYGGAVYLLAACFLAAFWRKGLWIAWIIGMGVLCVAFSYEIGIGITIALSVVAFVWPRRRNLAHRSALIVPAVAAVSFSIWRWLWQVSTETAYGHSVGAVTFSPKELLTRLVFGYRANLQWVWTDAILDWWPFLGQNTRMGRVLAVVMLGALVLGLMGIINVILKRRMVSNQIAQIGTDLPGIKQLVEIAGLALMILGAGYFPIILAVFPGMDYVSSRTHHLPSIGAAIFVCVVLFAIARLFTRVSRRRSVLAVVGMMPFLLLGVGAHVSVQQQVDRAWEDQKWVWQSLFVSVPDIVDGTQVVMIVDDYQNDGRGPGPFISGSWGMSAALNMLYGSKDLSGVFFYGPRDDTLWIDDALLFFPTGDGKGIPVDEVLVFIFDGTSKQMTQLSVKEVDGEMIFLGEGRILDSQPQGNTYRWLVQD